MFSVCIPDGDIVLSDVTFGYNKCMVLNGCSYRFEKGKHYALLGESGAGKSTLLHLLACVYDNYTGTVSIGNMELKTAGRRSIAKKMAVVSQSTFLFHDTIKNNITLFDDSYSDEEVKLAAEKAGLAKLLRKLPDGLSTELTDDGNNLSGGERQRIGLARALLRNVDILLLDEFTANLDEQTASELEENVLSQNKTILAVTHRMQEEVLSKYDCVLKMQGGKVVAE